MISFVWILCAYYVNLVTTATRPSRIVIPRHVISTTAPNQELKNEESRELRVESREFNRAKRDMTEEKQNIVIVGAGIIGKLLSGILILTSLKGCCTAYYITRHPAFSLKTHTLSILEASSPASGASGKVKSLSISLTLGWRTLISRLASRPNCFISEAVVCRTRRPRGST
jgi:hypothetical protein